MRIEFQYTPQDLKHGLETASKRQQRTRRIRIGNIQVAPALIGWALFLGLAIMLYVLNRSATNAPPAPRPSPSPPNNDMVAQFLVPLIPWVLIFGFAWFFIFRQLRGRSRILEDNPHVYRPQVLTIDEQGLTVEEQYTRSELKWEAFWGFDETKKAFVLYSSNPKSLYLEFRVVPKSAFANPEEMEQFRSLLQSRIHPRESAFPVLPPKSGTTS